MSASHQENQEKGILPVAATYYFSNGSALYTIEVPASLELNDSTVQCIVFNGSKPHVYSPVVKLLVQGNVKILLLITIIGNKFIIIITLYRFVV